MPSLSEKPSLFQTRIVKFIPFFKPKPPKNHTLWRDAFLFSPGVPPDIAHTSEHPPGIQQHRYTELRFRYFILNFNFKNCYVLGLF